MIARRVALAALLAAPSALELSGASYAHGIKSAARWHIVVPNVPGPFIDAAADGSGNIWLSSRAVAGFIRIDARDHSRVFETPGFIPGYLAFNPGDGRIYATSADRHKAIGALTPSGQLTIYLLPQQAAGIPASKPTVIPQVDWLYYAGRAQFGFLTPGIFTDFSYPSGLTTNNEIATTTDPTGNFWVTECCQGGVASLLEFTEQYKMFEFPLPAVCVRPAGIAWGRDGNLHVPCSTSSGAAVMILFANGIAQTIPLPMRYETRVNSIAAGNASGTQFLYLAPGTTAALWSFDTVNRKLKRIRTPDGSVPTAVALTPRGIAAIAGAQLDIYTEP